MPTSSAPLLARSTAAALALCLAVGVFGGALFGAAFGALASVFHNGPELWTGVRESWGFFAVLGAAMGVAWGWAHRQRPLRPCAR
jgi:hypothetical protein